MKNKVRTRESFEDLEKFARKTSDIKPLAGTLKTQCEAALRTGVKGRLGRVTLIFPFPFLTCQAFMCSLLILLACSDTLFAGPLQISGAEDGIWIKDGGLSVVVARVTEVKELKAREDGATHELKFDVIATLAGYCDPSETDSLTVQMRRSNILNLPPAGSTVVAVLMHTFVEGDQKRPILCVGPDFCDFMPNPIGMPLVVISGIDDKRVAETLAALRKARAHVAKPPTTAPTPP